MIVEPRWTTPAQDDLAGIDDYYAGSDPEYATRVGRDAIAAGRFLAQYPEAGAVVGQGFRRWRVGRTPYLLWYQVADGQVVILRVAHDRRGDLQL